MNLIALVNEVLSKGFDGGVFRSRITQYLNDAQNLVARRVDYYVDEATSTFSTTAGTATYAWPTGLARMRSVFDTDRSVEMQYASIRDIDRSGVSNGAPAFYALTGKNIMLWPTPDAVFNLEMRYWAMPAALVNDSDVPSIPADWTHLLWVYATSICYEDEDDLQTAQYYMGRFEKELSMFAADVKFPDTDGPTQAKGMWQQDTGLSVTGSQWGAFTGL